MTMMKIGLKLTIKIRDLGCVQMTLKGTPHQSTVSIQEFASQQMSAPNGISLEVHYFTSTPQLSVFRQIPTHRLRSRGLSSGRLLSTCSRATTRSSHSSAPVRLLAAYLLYYSRQGCSHHTPADEANEDHECPRWDKREAPNSISDRNAQPIFCQRAIERMEEALVRLLLFVLLLQVDRSNLRSGDSCAVDMHETASSCRCGLICQRLR